MSIAAFLLELWARLDRDAADASSAPAADKPQFRYKFGDLGCGNGLLTFFLTAEGYSGYGVDLRRRRLWDMFDPKPELREEAILPNERLTLPEYVKSGWWFLIEMQAGKCVNEHASAGCTWE